MFGKKLLLLTPLLLLTGLLASVGHSSAAPLEQESVAEGAMLGTSEPMLFEELWPLGTIIPNERWETTAGTWSIPLAGTVIQSDTSAGQINIAYETVADIADGVIYGSMFLLSEPPSQTLIPHGFVFRYNDINNFYGVGFLDEDTVALGRMVGGPF